jgi:hypothetical protein
MTNITAPIQCRPWLKDELARVDREITAMQREIGILQEGLNDLEIERADLIDQLDQLDKLYELVERGPQFHGPCSDLNGRVKIVEGN